MVASAIVARKEGVLDDAIFNDERDYEPDLVPAANLPVAPPTLVGVPRREPLVQRTRRPSRSATLPTSRSPRSPPESLPVLAHERSTEMDELTLGPRPFHN